MQQEQTMQYQKVVEVLEWTPDCWRLCEVMAATGTGLGYLWHSVYEGYVPYHLASGRTMGVIAQEEEGVRMYLQAIAPLADWRLDLDILYRLYQARDLQAQVYACVDAICTQGYTLLHAEIEEEEGSYGKP